ncbi:hypothetical protein BU25DRAFT_490329 [Macroventuria anomochaeta]|uniref:Uncharacterized protein n=1 Tax=Macroventuria anomochaeta TaxID=301207 RepID=A0ACB6S643_9PLEO|nr:uncharacterized protein BU25DRAFT_490329 [Macroventuria anomochaeta]KAF2628689.1 hypothetical protein BU25DRAFT_490329 [Macroventuria anomochaeta]
MSNSKHYSWEGKDWSDLRSYDTVHPQLEERRRQEAERRHQEEVRRHLEEVCRMTTPTRRGQYDNMSYSSGSSLSLSSLYANPPSPVLRPGLPSNTGEHYTSLQDVPHFSLNNIRTGPFGPGVEFPKSPVAERRGSVSTPYYERYGTAVLPKTPPPTLPPVESAYYQRPPGLTHTIHRPLPKVLRVVSPDPPAPTDTVSILPGASIIGQAEFRQTQKAKSGKLNSKQVPSEEGDTQKYNSFLKVKAALQEKRKVDADVEDASRKLEAAFQDEKTHESKNQGRIVEKVWCVEHCIYDWCGCVAEKLEGCKYGFSAPSNLVKKSADKKVPSPKLFVWAKANKVETKQPKDIPESSCADPTRFVDFIDRQRAMRASDASRIHRERQHQLEAERLQKLADKRMKEYERAEEESMKIEGVTLYGTETLSTMAPKEEVKASTASSSESPSKILNGPSTLKASLEVVNPKIPVTSNTVVSKVGAAQFIEAMAAERRKNLESVGEPTIQIAGPKGTKLSNDTTGSGPRKEQEAVSEAVGADPNRADTLRAAKVEGGLTAIMRVREKYKALLAKHDAERKWDNVDLSDDEDWEKVVGDEGAEWEVLEK